VRIPSSFPAEHWERSPADPTGPRFLIEDIYPCVDGGRYPVKRIAGESVEVWADIFREGHDVIAAALLWRPEAAADWRREQMQFTNNDRWRGHFTPPKLGTYLFVIEAGARNSTFARRTGRISRCRRARAMSSWPSSSRASARRG
jgi:starch synthase (maltosyl-transferring)